LTKTTRVTPRRYQEDQFSQSPAERPQLVQSADLRRDPDNGQDAPEADIVKNCLALTRPSKGQRLLEAPFDNASPPGGSAVQFANGGF
jgi:hypothetical protein